MAQPAPSDDTVDVCPCPGITLVPQDRPVMVIPVHERGTGLIVAELLPPNVALFYMNAEVRGAKNVDDLNAQEARGWVQVVAWVLSSSATHL